MLQTVNRGENLDGLGLLRSLIGLASNAACLAKFYFLQSKN